MDETRFPYPHYTDPDIFRESLSYSEGITGFTATLTRYHWLADQLRQLGFIEDISEDAPICRWKADDVILDIMPTDPKILGFGNQWFTPAFEASEWTVLPSGKQIRLLPAPYSH